MCLQRGVCRVSFLLITAVSMTFAEHGSNSEARVTRDANGGVAPGIPVTVANYHPEVKGFTALGYIKPRHSKTISASPWGIQAGTMDEKFLARAAEIGVKWTRLGATWPSIEREKGKYDWTRTDQAFRTVIQQG